MCFIVWNDEENLSPCWFGKGQRHNQGTVVGKGSWQENLWLTALKTCWGMGAAQGPHYWDCLAHGGGFVSYDCCFSADPFWAALLHLLLSHPNPDSGPTGLDNSRCSRWAGPLLLPRDAGHQPTADRPPFSGRGPSCGTETVPATMRQRAASLKSQC